MSNSISVILRNLINEKESLFLFLDNKVEDKSIYIFYKIIEKLAKNIE